MQTAPDDSAPSIKPAAHFTVSIVSGNLPGRIKVMTHAPAWSFNIHGNES